MDEACSCATQTTKITVKMKVGKTDLFKIFLVVLAAETLSHWPMKKSTQDKLAEKSQRLSEKLEGWGGEKRDGEEA